MIFKKLYYKSPNIANIKYENAPTHIRIESVIAMICVNLRRELICFSLFCEDEFLLYLFFDIFVSSDLNFNYLNTYIISNKVDF